MAKIFYDHDANLDLLTQKKIGILGYGNQGRAQALNMRDSGLKKIYIGTAKDRSYDRAIEDGFELLEIQELTRQSDILFILIPDEIMPQVYEDQVAPFLNSGKVLNFASGYNITFNHISPPADTDVIMVAPRMIGEGVRNYYLNGQGYPAFIAVENDATGTAKQTALALAQAIGATKMGAIEVTFKDETMLDLLAEQAIWPMILSVLTEAFKFEVDKGHPAEASLVELYISKEPAYLFEKMAEEGLYKQMPYHSHTSQYGQLSRAKSLDKKFIRETLEKAYRKIESGEFAQEWKKEQEEGLPNFKKLFNEAIHSEITRLEEKILSR